MSDTLRLLDTSIVVCHFRGVGQTSERLQKFAGLFLPNIALGELYAGAYRSARQQKNLQQIEEFKAGVTVLVPDDETARNYGRISAQLAAQGTPIPQNDAWIAAYALQWGLTLATADHHFSHVPGLEVELW